jgi:hypothetical protein
MFCTIYFVAIYLCHRPSWDRYIFPRIHSTDIWSVFLLRILDIFVIDYCDRTNVSTLLLIWLLFCEFKEKMIVVAAIIRSIEQSPHLHFHVAKESVCPLISVPVMLTPLGWLPIFSPEHTVFVTVKHLLRNKSICLYIVTKVQHKFFSSIFFLFAYVRCSEREWVV